MCWHKHKPGALPKCRVWAAVSLCQMWSSWSCLSMWQLQRIAKRGLGSATLSWILGKGQLAGQHLDTSGATIPPSWTKSFNWLRRAITPTGVSFITRFYILCFFYSSPVLSPWNQGVGTPTTPITLPALSFPLHIWCVHFHHPCTFKCPTFNHALLDVGQVSPWTYQGHDVFSVVYSLTCRTFLLNRGSLQLGKGSVPIVVGLWPAMCKARVRFPLNAQTSATDAVPVPSPDKMGQLRQEGHLV